MRLINVDTYELEEFVGSRTPEYAILSHRWGPEEVTFHEWQTSRETAKGKAGYKKIEGACHKAKELGWQYLWCDTNCIDKSSSAELSEAINSMFAWYRYSRICLAYLDDVEISRGVNSNPTEVFPVTPSFRESMWFTRGWTLQELLAPKDLDFFSKGWERIGSKRDLASVVSEITRIPKSQVQHFWPHETSAASRMSWAADRETTRVEDMAYCLLGIFGVSDMPLLYGEGNQAFVRLQEAIL